MANDVRRGEANGRDAFHSIQLLHRIGETGLARVGKVDLMRVAADHHPAPHAEARKEHFHLQRRGILRLIEDDESVVESTPAHERDRSDLDLPARDAALDLLGRKHVESAS